MRNRSKIMILAAAIAGLLLVPATALAYTSSPDVGGGCDAEGTCVFEGLDADTPFEWEASFNPVFDSGSGTTNADGEAVFTYDASDVPAGSEITVSLTGVRNGETVTFGTVVATVSEDGEIIPVTGSEAGLLALGAFGALAVGGAALFVARRKRTTV